jgi:hypothetical protein
VGRLVSPGGRRPAGRGGRALGRGRRLGPGPVPRGGHQGALGPGDRCPCGPLAEVQAAALAGFEILIAGSGHLWPLGNAAALAAETQTWVREPATGLFRLDIFREPHDGSTWICRRDTSIRRPYRDVIGVTADGVPFLVPEIVLLFKAKHRRPKDEADFTGTLPLLDPAQRSWLASALAIVHPGHPWLSQCPP